MNQTKLHEFARAFFAAVDDQHADGLRPYLSDNVRLQMANFPASHGVESLVDAFKATEERFSSITHDVQGICIGNWSEGDVVSVEAIAHYVVREGGNRVSLPVTSTLRLNGEGKVADYRIFIDPAPAFA
ncbi:nuclear transport factor 2 family protein [Ferrimonas sp. YFM]|uniref:nuclear transport factor 2 family protein n=1 Tax=Ferrimonas sp. YFM TaxID=3028878 RepID=UPI002573D7F3|nr:nuclear transport factor 2 family protein [Ferrimonas sp. YFM]BDY05052.1 hypothetical protein F0521_20930 [Ferrimonas sp. YFM]